MVFFGSLFPPVDNMTENAFARDLGDIVQRCTRYGITTDHDAKRVGYSGTQLGHSTRASTINSTERESIRQEYNLNLGSRRACYGRSAAASWARQKGRLLAGISWTRRSKRSHVFFSEYRLRPPQAAHARREMLAGPVTGLTQFPILRLEVPHFV